MTDKLARRRRRWGITGFLAGAVAALTVVSAGIAEAQRAGAPRRRRPDPIQVGQVAPDFELPTLDSVLANIKDRKVQEDRLKKVKLSGFRGKRAVCLMFTSCT